MAIGQPLDPIQRVPAAARAIGVSPSLLHSMVKHGTFPPPIRITSRCIGWKASTIQNWITARAGEGYTPHRDRTQAATEARIKRRAMRRQAQPEAA